MALTLADLIPLALLQRPMMGGPAFPSALPKSQTNVTAGNPSAPAQPPISSPAQFLAAMTEMSQAGPLNEARKAQADQLKRQAEFLKLAAPMLADLTGGSSASSAAGPMMGSLAPPSDSLIAQPQRASETPVPSVRDMGGGLRSGMMPRDAGLAFLMDKMPGTQGTGPAPPINKLPFTMAPPSAEAIAATAGPGAPSAGTATPLPASAIPPPRGGAAPTTGQTSPAQAAALAGALSGALVPGGASVPQAPQFGAPVPGGSSVDPMKLARLRALVAFGGISGDPLGGFSQMLYNSPEHKAALEAATKGVELQYAGPLAAAKKGVDLQFAGPLVAAEEAARDPYRRGMAQFESELAVQKAWRTPTDLQKALLAANIDPNSPQGREVMARAFPDNRPDAERLADAAGVQGDDRSKALAGAIPGNAPTSGQKEYQAYVEDQQSRGQPAASFFEWQVAQRKAGATNVEQRVEGQGQAALVKAGIDAMGKAHEAELAANKRTQLLGQMAEAMQGFTPGATAELRLRATSILKDIGITAGDNVPPAELFRQAARRMQVAVQPQGQGAVSNFERELFSESLPRMVDSPESLAKALDIARRLDDYDRRVAQIHREASKGGLPNYVEAQKRIAELGPPLSAAELAALDNLRQGKNGADTASDGNAPDGSIAVNPQTGERLIRRGGKWEPAQ